MPFQIIRDRKDADWCDAVVDTSAASGDQTDLDGVHIELVTDNSRREDHDELRTVGIGEYELIRPDRGSSKYRIHAPIPQNGMHTGPEIIRHCYRSALQIVSDLGLKSVAFPLIGSEFNDCPKETALKIAADEISGFLKEHGDVEIILFVQDKRLFCPSPSLLSGLSEYIRYVERQEKRKRTEELMLDMASTGAFPAITSEIIEEERRRQQTALFRPSAPESPPPKEYSSSAFPWKRSRRAESVPPSRTERNEEKKAGLVLPFASFQPERGAILDESFSQMVLRMIDERGFEKDSDCYSRANIDRRLFSRIRCDEEYHPKKTTAVALAIALELSLSETNELLLKAGYSLSHSILFDVIIEYCILQNNYDIFEINELLFQYDQPLLGA